jgi:SAM-dependent methyltransferase
MTAPMTREATDQWCRLPVPPVEMRTLVGPTEREAFDNPTGGLVLPGVPPEQFECVLDFGCGCGRLARQLIQQVPRPRRYLGFDLHRGMIEWCRQNLQDAAPGFEFRHHDVFELAFNPNAAARGWQPFPVGDERFSLVIAWSVFTHLLQPDVVGYLDEVRRVLAPGGIAMTTWFLFNKEDMPMMQEEQNALYINPDNPTNAVIFDRRWLRRSLADAGLVVTRVVPPVIRGFQWVVELSASDGGAREVDFPDDVAPPGVLRAPHSPVDAHLIGLPDG